MPHRTENAVRNIVFGFINKMIVLLCPFIIRTILIKQLGSEYLGLSSLFTSILQVLSLTELGFSSAVVFSMYKPIAENDKKTICALMNFYKKVYRIIGLVILFVGLAITPFIKYLISGSYPENINIYILYILYLVNTSITYFLFAYKSALLTAEQRSDIVSNVSSIAYIVQYILQILALCLWKNYYLYVGVTIIGTVVNNLLCSYRASKLYPDYVPKGKISKNLSKSINKQVKGLMIQKISMTSRNSLDSIFISAFLGLNMVAIYSNYYSIMSAIIGILGITTSSIVAGIGNSITIDSVEKNYKDMLKFNFMYMWISSWCTTCLICLYQQFMNLWLGEAFLLSDFTVMLFCLYFYILKSGDILSCYTQASGIWWEGRYKSVIETLLNLILNFFLGKYFGINGILLATIISLGTFGFIYGSQIVFNCYFKKISSKKYFVNHLIYFVVTLFIGTFTYFICKHLPLTGFLKLFVSGITCLIVPNVLLYLVYCKSSSFKEAKDFLKFMLKRKES